MNLLGSAVYTASQMALFASQNPEAVSKAQATFALARIPMRIASRIHVHVLGSGTPSLGTVGDGLVEVIMYIARIVGIAMTAFGGFQLATSFTAHDSAQKRQGIMELLGGLIILLLPSLIRFLTGDNDIVHDVTEAPF